MGSFINGGYYNAYAIVDTKLETWDDMDYYSEIIKYIRTKRDYGYSIVDCLQNLKLILIEQTGQDTIEDFSKLCKSVQKAFKIPDNINLELWYLEQNIKDLLKTDLKEILKE